MKTLTKRKHSLVKDSWDHFKVLSDNLLSGIDNRANGSILNGIGNTPLLKISKVTKGINPDVEIYAKAEWYNPGGSVKDRAALNMILEGEKSGELKKGKIIIDATSGNTGI